MNRRICLLARPASMRKALVAYLRSFPEVEVTHHSDEPDAVLAWVSEQGADVLVTYDELCEWDLNAYLEQIRAYEPQIHCVVIVPELNLQTGQLTLGANRVLQRGLLDDNLRAAVTGNS
jgi:DNA-binding NarL/FixJ family response regulator